ncbi:2-octaprenyl-6-methoxyphenyl hydroxylase [Lysobacter silvisoli]|uniref:2-octaprenyl-6-methoxyphenyl hydroxylase n=1 Tax=Lysobacter silvisoli TaxID=2293254 RepID=A0A371JYZ0_9GAMM|nr:2-octaprenyl-6-methoxyphenyl hydroxylase [Lysobacter silvisoli]RDZ26893.1 2-octaprenyl-6-methoxyphenyl hydroxylase [Lysobacter silvisoli]
MNHDASAPAGDPAQILHDVLIVGGGLVGASLAIALQGQGLQVGLVEAAPPGALPAVFDERNLSFAEATVNALGALGVLQKLRAPAGAIRRIHISRRGDFGRSLLDAQRYGRDEFGRVVVARDFGDALEARLAELPQLLRYRPVRFVGLAEDDDGARAIRVADAGGERVLRARLLVAADGTRSGVREALGIAADEHDYGQTLFVTRLRAERAPDGTAYERLDEGGPTALLPRGDGHYGLVHGVLRERADAVSAMDEAAFLAHAQDAFGWRAGRFLACGARSAYPAQRVLAQRCTAARAVLVGNAAQTIHPIGAQGFNLGLRDALTLAELIAAARADDAAADCGGAGLLADYQRRRAQDRERTIAFSDGLARVTSNESPLLRPLRSLGLFAADRLPSAQAWLVGGAMGYRGDVPALCRGARA